MLDLASIPFIQAAHFTQGRNGRNVELIVIHDEESPDRNGSARNVAHFFATTAQASAHLTVDNLEAVQCVSYDDTAWQCKNANQNGIGIEHAGYASESVRDWESDYNKAMLELSAQIAAALCKEYGVPAQIAEFAGKFDPHVVKPGFTRHMDVPLHGSHSDPGESFPFQQYVARVAQIIAEDQASANTVAPSGEVTAKIIDAPK